MITEKKKKRYPSDFENPGLKCCGHPSLHKVLCVFSTAMGNQPYIPHSAGLVLVMGAFTGVQPMQRSEGPCALVLCSRYCKIPNVLSVW